MKINPILLVSLICGHLLAGAHGQDIGSSRPPTSGSIETVSSGHSVAANKVIASQPGTQESASPTNEIVPLIVIDDVPLTDAIRNLARQSNLNFQFDPKITQAGSDGKVPVLPNVTIRFENVTAQQALQAVLENHNLMIDRNPKSSIATIRYKDPKGAEPLVSRVLQLKYSSPTNMVSIIKSTLSDQRSQVLADSRTSQLIVVTTEKEMETVTNLLAKLDTPTKQVLIEARLLETAMNPTTIKGIDWSGTLEAQNFSFGNGHTVGTTTTTTPGATTTTTTPGGRSITTASGTSQSSTLLTDIGNGGISANTAMGFHPATAFLNADGVRAVLSFLNKDSETKVVAEPRAVTADNETALLEVTRAFPIFKITPGSANTPAGAEITYTNLGTILQVTPRISANSNIALKVIPEVSNIDSVDRQVVNGTENTANIYAIRRVETHVIIPSGNTLVMGGLISDSSSKTYTKVPILGDAPLIGRLFRKDAKTRNKSNLLIFVTPTIVRENDFQPTQTDFLQTKLTKLTDEEPSAWDSGKPYDWTKPKEHSYNPEHPWVPPSMQEDGQLRQSQTTSGAAQNVSSTTLPNQQSHSVSEAQ